MPPPRPDPEKGVFETLLVVAGRPIELDAHLARLAASLEALFDSDPPPDTRDLAFDRARQVRLGRLRLTVAPGNGRSAGGDGRLEVGAVAAEVESDLVFPSRERAVALRSVSVDGGLGKHKWIDRTLLERAGDGAGAVPMLVDRDGMVLEASRASVFAVRDGAPVTPPADGRILPGITRDRVVELARTAGLDPREERLSPSDLLQADEVFLAGSVRGVEPVRSIDGIELDARGEVTSAIAAELRRSWLGQELDLS